MCGFLGYVGQRPDWIARLPAALASIAHRGPDGEGLWSSGAVHLGHRRLAILDLSARGTQPMLDPRSGCAISFNGEIYNYLELRAELEADGVAFHTGTDTEVLLRAYVRWGEAMLPKLNGMWAFAIWDPRRNALFLSRDRFGVKPCYYAIGPDGLLFGSEPKALLTIDPSLAEVDAASLRDLLVSSSSFGGDRSYYRRIRTMQPGHYAFHTPGERELRQMAWWSYPDARPQPSRSPAQDAEHFAALLDDAVKIRMRSDVRVGLTLSGGLDSTAILASATGQDHPPLSCFTAVFSETSRGEEDWARLAARRAGTNVESVVAETGAWMGTLERITWHLDAPGSSAAVFPLWSIMRRARADNVPVLLEGQGADELLTGYPQYMPIEFASVVGRIARGRAPLSAATAHLGGSVDAYGLGTAVRWYGRALLDPVYPLLQRAVGRGRSLRLDSGGDDRIARPDSDRGNALLRRLQRDHSTAVLPALLHYGDAVSMAHGIESRLPFMDYRLVEWVFANEPRLIEAGRSKTLIRKFLDARGFPETARRKDKQGFTVPMQTWLRASEGRIRDELFGSPNTALWSVFDRGAAERLFGQALRGNYFGAYHFYKLLAIHFWLKHVAHWNKLGLTYAVRDAQPPPAPEVRLEAAA